MSMAEGVIVATARSMHGEALSEEMYQELLHKKSAVSYTHLVVLKCSRKCCFSSSFIPLSCRDT